MRCGPRAAGNVLAAATMLLVATAAGLLGVARATPVAAATDCVGVVVDARLLGGSVRTGCALGDPTSGLAALTKAGFGYTPRPRDGLICQVDAQPASCATTTSSRYWSYWYRAPGSGTWVYANEGAGTHNPKPGTTEAWVWQDGGRRKPPSIALTTICPQAASPAPTKTRTRTPRPTPTTSATHRPDGSTSPTTHRSATRTAGTPTPAPTTTSATAPPSATTSASTSTSTSTATAAAPSATTPPSDTATSDPTPSGSPDPEAASSTSLPTVAGAALGGVLAAGIGVAAYVRSRRGHP